MKRLIRLREVISTTGLSRSEIYRLEVEGKFCKRVPLTERTTSWDADEIQAWIQTRIAEREKATEQRRDVGRRLTSTRLHPRVA